MNGIRAGIRDTRQKIKIWIQGTTQSPSSILPRPRARCGWIASTFFSAPFLSWGDILKKVKRGILGKVWQVWWTDVSHLSSDLRNVETFQILFPVPPGWEKILCDRQPINWLPLKSTAVFGFSQVECSSHLKADSVAIRREFFWISSDFAFSSVVDCQGSGFLLSEDENSVDSGSFELGHFRSGREKGEMCCVVVFG